MTKRKMLAIIIALVMVVFSTLLLTSCTQNQPDDVEDSVIDTEFNGFIVLGDAKIYDASETNDPRYLIQYIMYDPDTMVMYTYMQSFKGGSISIIYNSDGTPKLYTPNAETN